MVQLHHIHRKKFTHHKKQTQPQPQPQPELLLDQQSVTVTPHLPSTPTKPAREQRMTQLRLICRKRFVNRKSRHQSQPPVPSITTTMTSPKSSPPELWSAPAPPPTPSPIKFELWAEPAPLPTPSPILSAVSASFESFSNSELWAIPSLQLSPSRTPES